MPKLITNLATLLSSFVIFSSNSLFLSTAEANHDYLIPHRGLLALPKTVRSAIRFSSPQDTFEYEPEWDTEFRSTIRGPWSEYRYHHLRSIWHEIEVQNSNRSNQIREGVQKNPTSGFSSLSLERAGPKEASIHFSFTEIRTGDSFTFNLTLKAIFIQGDWKALSNREPYILKLTEAAQGQFDQTMKERFENLIFQRFLREIRPNLAKKHFWIKKLDFMSFHTSENSSAKDYFKSLKRKELETAGAYTYFFGDQHGVVCTYPDYDIKYEYNLTRKLEKEMNWAAANRSHKKIAPLVSISL